MCVCACALLPHYKICYEILNCYVHLKYLAVTISVEVSLYRVKQNSVLCIKCQASTARSLASLVQPRYCPLNEAGDGAFIIP